MLQINKIFAHNEIFLPASKSISNRALIIQSISGGKVSVSNVSDAEDSVVLANALKTDEQVINIGHAGTAMRFLTAYFSMLLGERILTGSSRMKERPIKILVEALQSLGADISYLENPGFPPLKVKGKALMGGVVEVNAGISSQYITALMLIGPSMPKGLKIKLIGSLISFPYIKMAADLMTSCGIKVELSESEISIAPGFYEQTTLNVEADWSAASYFFQYASFRKDESIFLKGISPKSIQGDAVLIEIFENFGVSAKFFPDGCLILGGGNITHEFNYDFTDCPDLAQTVAAAMAGLGVKGKLSGLKSLRIKETDRIEALKSEFSKFKLDISIGEDYIVMPGSAMVHPDNPIATHQDHRMAMCMAPLAVFFEGIKIESPEVVNKSFPQFWKQFHEDYFEIK
jgi:3-phosphoshikimate 1-carboxyvinyltransferase